MPDAALSQREFDTWREGDQQFKQQLLDHMERQTDSNLRTENRITTLEAQSTRTSVRSGLISTVVSAMISGVFSVLKG